MRYEGANVQIIGGRPHDIRCPQSGRSDVDDCCKPMVAFTATNDERERCAKLVDEFKSDSNLHSPLDHVLDQIVKRMRGS